MKTTYTYWRLFLTGFALIFVSAILILKPQQMRSETNSPSTSTIGINSTPKSLYEQLSIGGAGKRPSATSSFLPANSGHWSFSEVFAYRLSEFWNENNIAVADFDHDGLKDIVLLVTTTYETVPPWNHVSKIILLHNEGNWQFSDSIIAQYPEGSYGYTMQADDLNNDGWTDLVVRVWPATRVLLNNQFGDFNEVWIGGPGYDSLDLSDMNGDSFVDILSGTQTGNGGLIELFRNNGAGTSFAKTWESALYGQDDSADIHDVSALKLNADSFLDIAATEIYEGLLLTFSGDGTGTSFTEEGVLNLGDRTFSLATGKINDDSLTDLAVYVGWGQVRTFLAQADNSISGYWQSPYLGDAAYNLALKEFDQDGYDDLFVGTFGDGALYIYRNNSGNDFELMWSGNLTGQGYAGTVADLDDDGYPELIVVEQNSNGWSTMRILCRRPMLSVNYDSGAPGSFFTVTGNVFPVNSNTTIIVNGQTLSAVPTNNAGDIAFILSTANADEGAYFVTTGTNPRATTTFYVDSAEPMQPQDGNGTLIDVPAGIALAEFNHLPLLLRE